VGRGLYPFHPARRADGEPARAGIRLEGTNQRLFQAVAGDLLDELGYETVGLGRMSLAEQMRHAALRTKYTVFETGRQAVQTIGIFHPTDLLTRRLRLKLYAKTS